MCGMVKAQELLQYRISKHFTILKNAGLLKATREGAGVYNRLDQEETPLLRDLSTVLSRHLGQVFAEDVSKLTRRLTLWEIGKCVVGFVQEEELKQLIKNKLEELS